MSAPAQATTKAPRLRDFLPAKFVTTPTEFNDAIERVDESGLANVICPVRIIDYIPPVMAISFRVVPIADDGWYKPSFGKDGALALKGESIAILWREAGGKILPSTRTDDGTLQHVRGYQANVVLRAMNGRDLPTSKSRELDLRPGAPEFEGMKNREGQPLERMREQARMVIDRVCETKAQLRAIRSALGIRQMYTPAEAKRPFVIPTLVPNPDMENPLHANFMLAHATDTVDQLFGKRKELPSSAGADGSDVARVDLRTGEIVDDAIDAEETGHVVNAAADLAGFEEPAAAVKCTCPCGCTATVSAEAAEITTKRCGSPRCAACYPGSKFDEDRHKGLATLQMTPDVTVKQAREMKAAALKGGQR